MTIHQRLRGAETKQTLLRRLRGQPAENLGRWTRDDLYDEQEKPMSTKASIEYHNEEGTPGGWFHLYNEVFDDHHVYLEFGGVPFEAASCAHLDAGTGSGSVTIRILNDWARRLGLIANVQYLDSEEEDRALLEGSKDTSSSGESEPASVVEIKHDAGLPARGYAYTRPDGTIIVNSVRETRDAVRPSGAEGIPIRVMITQMTDDSAVE
jgi:hypothetical protein